MDEDARGALTPRSSYTHLNGQTICKTQDRVHEELYLYNVCHGAFWDSSFRSCLLSIIYTSTNVLFDYTTLLKNQYIICVF